MTFQQANQVAEEMCTPTREIHFARVRAAPVTSFSWHQLMQQTREDQIDEVIAFAESALPLGRIATGSAEENGLGPRFELHRALGWLLQELKRLPGHGWNLIRVGLRSPVVSNRVMAVRALAAWPTETWPPDALGLLSAARENEPHAETRENLKALLRRRTGN